RRRKDRRAIAHRHQHRWRSGRRVVTPPADHPAAAPAPTERDIAMMRRALELARAAGAAGEVPIGAVVYETATGRIVGEGSNTREHANDPAGHAELIAIRAAAMTPPGDGASGVDGGGIGDWRLNDCTLVVTLEPCAMCAGLIVNARLGRLVYGA